MAGIAGCWRAAEKAEDIAAALTQIRLRVNSQIAHDNISDLVRQMRISSQVLTDLFDLAPIYRERVPIILAHLDIILPILRLTLEDMRQYLSQADLFSSQHIWNCIYDHLVREGGVTPVERFRTYNEYIIQLVRRLSR